MRPHDLQSEGPTGNYDVPPRLLSGEAPIYPVSRIYAEENGQAVVEYTIGIDGKTKDVHAISATYKYFGAHAVIAVRKWRFTPAMKNGQPVELTVQETFKFEID